METSPAFWQCGSCRLDLNRAAVMGILNVTPDSFSDGGSYQESKVAIAAGLKLLADQADIVDVGGESTRPGAAAIEIREELRRVIPVIEGLRADAPDCMISIDTMKAEVARRAIEAGANIINDVSAGTADPEMLNVARESGAGVVLMHMCGTPQTMQLNPSYFDVVAEICEYLTARLTAAMAAGIAEQNIVLDPGIGFGKHYEHNVEIFRRLPELLANLRRPVLLGPSRKAFLGQMTGVEAPDRLLETAAACVIAASAGARLFRVHDVSAIRRALLVAETLAPLPDDASLRRPRH